MLRNSIFQSLDTLANITAAVVLSGGLKADLEASSGNMCLCSAARVKLPAPASFRKHAVKSLDDPWMAKVAELASRGISLHHLLEFYKGLGTRYMCLGFCWGPFC